MSANWVIVPVKALGDAKQRLAAVLPLEARRLLMLVMLHDVLAALKQVETLGPIVIVSPDPHVARIAEREGLLLLREARSTGHSAAVAAGLAFAKSHGAARALTLPADVPLVTADEVRAVLQDSDPQSLSPRLRGEGTGARITIVPSRDGDGSNAIVFEPLDALTLSFGVGSFARHTAQAAERGIACRTLSFPGIGLDIDSAEDLAELVRRTHGLARYAFLTEPDFASAGAER